ncbi:MAG: hypothetical protein Q9210_006958, partial [Variospora velana]
ENLSHYYLEPAEMLYAAWAPGMLHVHTEGYGNEGEAKGDYCNLEMRDVDELEAFMEDLIEKRVRVQQVTVLVRLGRFSWVGCIDILTRSSSVMGRLLLGG